MDKAQTFLLEDSESSSSFSKAIQSKIRKGLTPTETKLTSSDGSITVLKNQGSDIVHNSSQQCSKGFGFVVDTKPDLTIGEVRNWLFVSSQDVPNNLDLLVNNGISHILSLLPGFILDSKVKTIIKSHLSIDVYDEIDFKLDSPLISTALNFIHECFNSNRKVLVHCNAGVSRAPSIVILYLMKYEQLNYEDALKAVQNVRQNARPNDGFVKQLRLMTFN